MKGVGQHVSGYTNLIHHSTACPGYCPAWTHPPLVLTPHSSRGTLGPCDLFNVEMALPFSGIRSSLVGIELEVFFFFFPTKWHFLYHLKANKKNKQIKKNKVNTFQMQEIVSEALFVPKTEKAHVFLPSKGFDAHSTWRSGIWKTMVSLRCWSSPCFLCSHLLPRRGKAGRICGQSPL